MSKLSAGLLTPHLIRPQVSLLLDVSSIRDRLWKPAVALAVRSGDLRRAVKPTPKSEGTVRDSTRTFLASVVPPIVNVVVLAVCYIRGDITGRKLLIGIVLLSSVWLVAGLWGYADWSLRQLRRQKKRQKNSE